MRAMKKIKKYNNPVDSVGKRVQDYLFQTSWSENPFRKSRIS